jgi:hypothetical protein
VTRQELEKVADEFLGFALQGVVIALITMMLGFMIVGIGIKLSVLTLMFGAFLATLVHEYIGKLSK